MARNSRFSKDTPGTLAEAVAMILVTFGEKELAEWAEKPMNEATMAHFDLGLWVRDRWVYGDNCPLVARIREFAGYIHDDGISSLILEALWAVLNDEDCPTVESLLENRESSTGD